MKKLCLVTILMLLALLTFYAIPGSSQGAQGSAQVSIKNYAFQPGTVTVAKGSTVTWTNEDSVKHTVKFSDSESPQLGKGQTYSKTFNSPGTFSYTCGIHPSMKGTVAVK